MEQIGLDVLGEQQAENRGGHEGDGEIAIERRIDAEKACAVLPDDSEHRTGLNNDVEHVPAIVARAQQLAREDQVPGTGDWQELGDALDNAEQECVDEIAHNPDFARNSLTFLQNMG